MSATIIKAETSGANSATCVRKEVHDASLEAKQVLRSAQSEAERIINEAESKRHALLEEAKKQGYAAGLEQWTETLVDAWKRRDEYLDQNESQLIKIAIAAAKKIIGEEVRTNPSSIRNTVIEALRSSARQGNLVIQVNPAQEAIMRSDIDNLRTLLGGLRDLTVSPNSEIEEGGCIVESDIGIIDARVSTQLAALEQSLLQRITQ
jgi:type III secretion system HrpE/YscL family protein